MSRLVKMIGWVAVPTALMRLPRLTASQDWPVPPKMITPGSIVRMTGASPSGGAAVGPDVGAPGELVEQAGDLGQRRLRVIRAGSCSTR